MGIEREQMNERMNEWVIRLGFLLLGCVSNGRGVVKIIKIQARNGEML